MSLDNVFMLAELGLLGVIVWQGELIRRYEKWTYEMNRERYEERAKWRKAKQTATVKKIEQKTDVSEKSLGSISPSTSDAAPSKTTSAKSVDGSL